MSNLLNIWLPLLSEESAIRRCFAIGALLFGLMNPLLASGQNLEQQLQLESPLELAKSARRDGDEKRGAILFFQQHMACSKCHSVAPSKPNGLGPNLALLPKETTDMDVVDSILSPSKNLRKGFESNTFVTTDGVTLTGLVVERNANQVMIREAARSGEITRVDVDQIAVEKVNPLSIMPAGQVNQLTNRQQFLDLVRYLLEIRDGGPSRAAELQPDPSLLAYSLPEYETHLDHVGLIQSWNDESYKRGEAIYQRVCGNCHGTRAQVGSLPTSLRFAEGKFKNGSDPFAIYQTLTHGFGQMVPQVWMVPSQKYDVIHYLREEYLRSHNPTQFVAVDRHYLDRLPKGDTRGPEPSKIEPWSAMDYGSSLTHTYQFPGKPLNLAYKGIAIRLDPGPGGISRGKNWMIFDTDTLRMAGAWSRKEGTTTNFIDWRGIQFNGEHQVHPRVVGEVHQVNSNGPGWSHPIDGSFTDDKRVVGRDGRRYGPLPRSWGQFHGTYYFNQRVVLSYSIGNASILESPRSIDREGNSIPWIIRTFNIGPRDQDLTLQVAEASNVDSDHWVVDPKDHSLVHHPQGRGLSSGYSPTKIPMQWIVDGDSLRLKIPVGKEPLQFAVWTTGKLQDGGSPPMDPSEFDLSSMTHGGPPRWPQSLTTQAKLGSAEGPFAVDFLSAPENNPWLALTRFTGLDFFADGRTALSTWDGDVWIVEGPTEMGELKWRRIASGLFQPLGLKIVENKIHLTCRDQLVVLHDLNGDQEIDFYQCLNNDHQVTEHFHEFAMGLQTDEGGNFYYAKSGRHALEAIVPHHGTLIRVSRDGSKSEILATGFRAANGVCLNPDGSFVVTDQEGFWNPKNRINWVTLDPSGKPKFYGNMFGYHDVTDSSDAAMVPPLCWITNEFDRSPAELLWVDSPRWGLLNHSLLNLSYGYGKVFLVPHEKVNGLVQGGMIELPIPSFPTGVMRGRFHPLDGQLYLCGMFAWAGNATHPGGFYRMRATGKSFSLPIELHAIKTGIKLRFTESLDPASIDGDKFKIKMWSLKRTEKYGSKHYDEKSLEIRGVKLSDDGKTVTIDIPNIQPTWCMEIKYQLVGIDGKPVQGVIHNTIHALSEGTLQ